MIALRRSILSAILATGISGVVSGAAVAADPLRVAMLIPGRIDDHGFMEAGYNGLVAIRDELGAEIGYVDGIRPEQPLLEEALRELAADGPDMVIAHGGQNSKAAVAVAPEFPDVRFVVVQGSVTGPNLSSYEVLQEQSAFLAGAAAGLLTQSGVVGHISGIRVPPGLKGRAAFADGLGHTNPGATFLTVFAGDQDDTALARKVAAAEIAQRADIIFTMLNAGRDGATEAIRQSGAREIGNVGDWTREDPEVFVASAVANVSMAALAAARDLAAGAWEPGTVHRIGLEDPEAVALTLAPDVPQAVEDEIDLLREQIVSGEIEVSTDYDGEEFSF